ncbi:hypothetical protein [Pareuzebyella sediminis]|uniref:hypothetical protein n=1 Tax=Pareuzebyella sediminis TaxID=2607998 RepID=UPI0011F06A52|nr:hypothetical protein [Pareuzebyella sediminis]
MTVLYFTKKGAIYKYTAILMFMAVASCSSEVTKYDSLVKEEMAKGTIHDSLLFGMRFGQTKKEFFDRCWQLNSKGIVKQGPNNQFVEYKLPKKKGQGLQYAITMLFYGIFNDSNTMTGMNFQFSYDGWSLWNEKLQSHELIHSVKDSLKKWYPGNDFIQLRMKKDTSEVYVKIDGNRRILIKPLDDNRIVKARIDDLRYSLDK